MATGYDVTSYFRLAFIKVRKTVDNAASDGFRSNFSGAAFCLPHQLVGILLFVVAVVLMGKNTMMRKAIRGHLENNPALEKYVIKLP